MNDVQILPRRHSIRLKNYDYSSAGAYFVTIVVNHRNSLFGEIVDEIFLANPAGKKISQIWTDLANRFPSIQIDEFCVMPNHFHGIVVINPPLNDHPATPVGAALVAALDTVDPHSRQGRDKPHPYTLTGWQRISATG